MVLEEFLAIATSFPTVVYTVLVLVSLGYWMISLVGLAGDHGDSDADLGDAGDDFGHVDSADAHVDHADAGDVGDGDADVDVDASHGHAHGDTSSGGALDAVLSVLGFLRLRNAPLSITFSVLFLFSWLFTYFGARYAMPLIPGPGALGGSLVSLAALIASVPITSTLTKPLGALFKQDFAPGKRHLVGRVGVVRIGAQKGKSAQIRLKEPAKGEQGLLIRVAVEEDLESGDEVLLVDYDDDKKAYVAEPMEKVLPSKD